MTDFLLELRSEEIPARMQKKASADLETMFTAAMIDVGLIASRIETYVTPRRLTLIAHDLPKGTRASTEEIKGPRISAPDKALEGFLRKTGLKKADLEDRDGIWFAKIEHSGRKTSDVLAEVVPGIVLGFPWPKSMRWGEQSQSTESLRWVRPLTGIVAMFDGKPVAFDVDGISSGITTRGHRFHHPDEVTIASADSYVDTLRKAKVIVDRKERQEIIRDGCKKLAADNGLEWIADKSLVSENAGLTEWPVPLLGDFDPAFLSVPREVIQLTLGTNQKYFVLNDAKGDLTPAFVCVANVEAKDGGKGIIEGNRKVLAARLADARHFWDQDRKKNLSQHGEMLERITFHEKLGSVQDKVDRVSKLAEWLVKKHIVKDADASEVVQAAALFKADLVTEMVGEFPELQGVIGGYYAAAEGHSEGVSNAIRDHYKPVGAGDSLPRTPNTLALSLADKLDTLASFFLIEEKPTGSRDPFALRRAALGVVRSLVEAGVRMPLRDVIVAAAVIASLSRLDAVTSITFPQLLDKDEGEHDVTAEVGSYTYRFGSRVQIRWDSDSVKDFKRGELVADVERVERELLAFIVERLKVQQREAGLRHDLIDAVFKAKQSGVRREYDLVRMLSRVKALSRFIVTDDGKELLAGYRRADNILKKEGFEDSDPPRKLPAHQVEPAELALGNALDDVTRKAQGAIEEENFEGAMQYLAKLSQSIDDFFENVVVNDEDNGKRAARLWLLARIREAVRGVADFSKIEG